MHMFGKKNKNEQDKKKSNYSIKKNKRKEDTIYFKFLNEDVYGNGSRIDVSTSMR